MLVGDSSFLEFFNPDAYSQVLLNALANRKPSIFLLGHTYVGMDIGPSLAARLDAGLASNCLDILVEGDRLQIVRPMYNGKVHAKVSLEPSQTTFLTLQKGAVKPKDAPRRESCEVSNLKISMAESDLRTNVIGLEEVEAGEVDLTKADIIVTGGRGLGEQENFKLIKDLAEALGGAYGCSRPLVDMGWLPSAFQIGLSGKTVKPKLYVACGISGASQHIVGMKDAAVIVAINKDANAPIFDVANYGIVGDLFEIVPLMIDEAKKLKK